MKIDYISSESTVKPAEIEFAKTTVYLRKDFGTRTDSSTGILFWTYQEAALTYDEFSEYSKMMQAKKAINDDDQLIIMEAIADLYDIINNLQQGGSTV